MVAVYFGDDLGRYGFGNDHPLGPDRIHAFWKQTVEQGLDKEVRIACPVRCDEDAPTRFHTREYVDRVRRQSQSGEGYLDYGDTPAFKGVFEAASFVVGSDLDGVARIISGEHRRVFVPIAGLHHARRDQAGGFCVFNDAGVVIETLRREFGIRRVAYVDIDAHHGDGVFYAFERDPDLVFADIHEDGRFLYPGTGFAHETGKGPAEGTKLNLPVMPGSDDSVFFRCWGRVEEFVRAGKPEFIVLQAGADSIAGDPITHMAFTPKAHAHAAGRLCALADEFCDGRFIALGGGGYNRRNLAAGWNEVVRAMLAA
ncbi:MAG: acetoin utilization protein AcuC [Arenicellales bacterium]